MTKEDTLDVAIKIIGIYWFLRSSVTLLSPLLFYSPFSVGGAMPPVYPTQDQMFAHFGPSAIALVIGLFLMVRSSAIVNLLYGRRSRLERDGNAS